MGEEKGEVVTLAVCVEGCGFIADKHWPTHRFSGGGKDEIHAMRPVEFVPRSSVEGGERPLDLTREEARALLYGDLNFAASVGAREVRRSATGKLRAFLDREDPYA